MKRLAPEKWDRKCAAHLLVRAGFGTTPEQIDAAAKRPMDEIIANLLKITPDVPPPDWVAPGIEVKPDFKAMRTLPEKERRQLRKTRRKEEYRRNRELINWWIHRMISSPCPLQEKMTLFWHGHFATSIRKVRSAYMMYLQNQMFRQRGMGSFEELVTAVAQDPAMLVYLDNTRSRSGAPNENFARELMELFTLGEGHYTEQDIRESARAFTGWMVAPRKYAFLDATGRRRLHDDGAKTFMGQTGNFDGSDIIRIILEQDQAARFIVTKLWRYFSYDNPEPEIVEALADEFRSGNYEIVPVLKSMFTSEAFYSNKAMRTQIKSPAQWLVGSCILLGIEHPDPRFCINALRSLGQNLFAPPNVKGWDGGYAWITTSTLTQRYNLVAALINARTKKSGTKKRLPYALKTDTVLPPEKRSSTEVARDYLEDRVYQTRLTGDDNNELTDFLNTLPSASQWTDAQIHNVLHAMMSTPEYQLT